MSEAANVRLVRCPKCENLLPEVTDFSVYQCGGCGAVLRAKSRSVEADMLSEKSDKGRTEGVLEKFSEKSEDRMMNLSNGSENDGELSGSSSSRAERRESNRGTAEKCKDGSADKSVVDDDLEVNRDTNDSIFSKMADEFEELESRNWMAKGSRISGHVPLKRGEVLGIQNRHRVDVDSMRYSTSKTLADDPLKNQLGLSYGYAEPLRHRIECSGLEKVEHLERDREDLLRKLDELKDQLSRSCDMSNQPREKVPVDRRMVHPDPYSGSENWYPDATMGPNRAPVEYSVPDKHVARPPYANRFDEPIPYVKRHDMPGHGFYSMPPPNQVQGFGDPFRSQMLRSSHHPTDPFPQPSAHPYFSGQYAGNDMIRVDPFEPNPRNVNLHWPSCSCFNCYRKHQHVLPPVPPPALSDNMFRDGPNDVMLQHRGVFGPQSYNPRIPNPPPLSHIPQSHSRFPGDLNSETGNFTNCRLRRVVIAAGGRHCHPVAGGAPIVACHNCFELLQFPQKLFLKEKHPRKMRCGACSTTILFTVANKKLVLTVPLEAERTDVNADSCHDVALYESNPLGYDRQSRAHTNISSDDYDNSGFDFQSVDREMVSSSTGRGQSSDKSAEMRSLHSTSSFTSEDEDTAENLIPRRTKPHSAELPLRSSASPQLAGSLQDHFDYSDEHHHSEPEKETTEKATLRQNSMKDTSLPTEIDISSNEYSNTGTSQDSGEGSREHHWRGNKVGESFFAGFIKRSFRDFPRSHHTNEQEQINVMVNGHPIPDRLVKKAEKVAGPIQPGQYWYDFRAGFWGVMGGPGLGIIPPFIEEFNYPMPEKCANGSTGVFVNGRELHQKDLNLLGNRGLPVERERSYIIEISGRVLDEDTGIELDGLGKLAPTVEKVKHGFGMKTPKPAAA